MAMALVVLLLLMLLRMPALAQQPSGCRPTCGDIAVPYPFGIGHGCYRENYFALECDDASSPSRLTLLGFSNNRFASLSLATGEATVYLNATRSCYDPSGRLVSRNNDTATFMELPTTAGNLPGYLFSAAKNWFVGLGCPNLSFFADATGFYAGGCTSVCRPSDRALPSLGTTCNGVGCCQTSIARGIGYYWPYQQVLEDKSSQPVFNSNVTACRYTFLVDADWFKLQAMDIRRTDDFQVPMVLDWAIRNVDGCAAARQNSTDFACRGTHAECFNSTNGPGYICNCSKGYQGNPYLDGGCIDVNECEQKDKYPCYGDCTNTPGNYTCHCRLGSSGNATLEDGCRQDDKFTLGLKVVTGTSS